MFYRFLTSTIAPLGELEFRGIAATAELLDDGYQLVMAGCNLTRFANGKGPLLVQHNPSSVAGVVTKAWTTASNLQFEARFASAGVSSLADETRRLLKDGMYNSISCGFDIQEAVPIQGTRGKRCTKWTLLEISIVSVPLDQAALVTERARGSTDRARRLAEVRALAPRSVGPDLSRWSERLLRMAEVERLRRAGAPGRHQLNQYRERQAVLRRLARADR